MDVVEVSGDECDQCPSDAHVQAYVYAAFKVGSISLCAHHGREGMAVLIEQGATIVDMTHLLHPDTP